jgi:hypothetical protein
VGSQAASLITFLVPVALVASRGYAIIALVSEVAVMAARMLVLTGPRLAAVGVQAQETHQHVQHLKGKVVNMIAAGVLFSKVLALSTAVTKAL